MTDRKFKPIIPNAVTMLALVCGVSCIKMALDGRWQMGVVFILLSCVFDFLDGKVARLLGVSSRFGAELDSLSDFVSFGVAPGVLMYLWAMKPVEVACEAALRSPVDLRGVPWAVALFLACCCAARLARFNSMLDEKQPDYWLHFFMGVPAPSGGGLAMYPLILWLATGSRLDFCRNPWFVSFFMVFSGVMMASRIPTFCLKHLRLNKTMRSVLGIVLLALIAGIVSCPWPTMAIVGIGYILSIPVAICMFLKFKSNSPATPECDADEE